MFNHTLIKDEKSNTTTQSLNKETPDTLESLCKEFKKISPRGINSIPSKEIWRFFLDGKHQADNQTWVNYETREPGYLSAMSLAFKFALEHLAANELFKLEFIKKLHFLALCSVDKTNYKSHPSNDKYEFDNTGHGIRIDSRTLTLQSLREILLKIKNGNPLINLHYGDITSEHGLSVINICNIDTFTDINAIAKTILYSDHIRLSGVLAGEDQSAAQKSAENYFNDLISSFEIKINKKTPLITKLRLIIELVTEFEQSHPYIDGNGRTFCTLLLNYLLLRHEFPPVILDNPNRFDSMDNQTLTKDIINGMQKTLELLQTKQLFGNKTEDLLLNYETNKNNDAIEIYNNSHEILKTLFDEPKVSATMKMK
jgi:hypothetical protein